MKKIVLIVALIAFAATSCKKETIVPNMQPSNSAIEESGELTLKSSSNDDGGKVVLTSDYNEGEGITDPNSDADEDRRKGKGK